MPIWLTIVLGAYIVVDVVLKAIALGTVPENRRPSSSTAWLLLIFLLPIIGFPLFWTIGSPYVRGRRARIQQEANQLITQLTRGQPLLPPTLKVSAELRGVIRMNHFLTSMPCVADTQLVDHFSDAHSLYSSMAHEVDKAKDVVDVQNYIMSWDETTDVFFSALVRARARGVRVRLLVDHLGSRKYPGWSAFKRRLTEANIDWHLMMPLLPLQRRWRRPDLRNHRKIVVIDHRIAFVGSHNIIDPSYDIPHNKRIGRRWEDLSVSVSGRIVHQLQAIFATDWYAETGADALSVPQAEHHPTSRVGEDAWQVVPSGPGFPTEPNRHQFVELMHHATRKMTLVSPYFVPDESLLAAIIGAAYRGVEVQLFVSEKSDHFFVNHAQRSYYKALLEAGVRIFLYPAPIVLHSKYLTVDDHIALIGSSNMDYRSFALNYEVMMLSIGDSLMGVLRESDQRYRAVCHELTLHEWSGRPWYSGYVDNACRLTSSLM